MGVVVEEVIEGVVEGEVERVDVVGEELPKSEAAKPAVKSERMLS